MSSHLANRMFGLFINPDQLIKEDTPSRLVLAGLNRLKLWGAISLILALFSLPVTIATGTYLVGGALTVLYIGLGVWLVTSTRSITFDLSQQAVVFSTHFLLLERKTRFIPFAEIATVYLDFEEQVHHSIVTISVPQERIRHKWSVFLALNNEQTVTLAYHRKVHHADRMPNLSRQTAAWERLATRICAVTDKLLIRTPSVPSRTPHTFVNVIDQILQRRLAALSPTDRLTDRSVRLRSHPNGSLEIVVDGVVYRNLSDISSPDVRDLIQEAVDEWKRLNGDSTTAFPQ